MPKRFSSDSLQFFLCEGSSFYLFFYFHQQKISHHVFALGPEMADILSPICYKWLNVIIKQQAALHGEKKYSLCNWVCRCDIHQKPTCFWMLFMLWLHQCIPDPSGCLGQVCFLSPDSELNTERQRLVFMLHISGTNSQGAACLL